MTSKSTVKLQGIEFSSFLIKELWKSIDAGLHNAIIKHQNEGRAIDTEYLADIGITYTDIVQLRNVENMLNNRVPFKAKYIEYVSSILSRAEYKTLLADFKKRVEFWENERKNTDELVSKFAAAVAATEGK